MFELRIHWQRQDFGRRPFCDRKISFFVPQACIGLLKVERYRVVGLSYDVGLCEMCLKSIPILNTDDIEVVDSLGSGRFVGQDNSVNVRSKQLVVPAGNCATSLVPPW